MAAKGGGVRAWRAAFCGLVATTSMASAEPQVWGPGYWAWDAAVGQYRWTPPPPQWIWVPPGWEWRDGAYVAQPGSWRLVPAIPPPAPPEAAKPQPEASKPTPETPKPAPTAAPAPAPSAVVQPAHKFVPVVHHAVRPRAAPPLRNFWARRR